MKRLLLLLMFVAGASFAFTQTGVLSPNDPIVVYDSTHPPTTPPSGTLVKWVKTNRMKWSTTSFKCYYYKGIPFRLKFPKSYSTNADGKTYPLYVFFHGKGEKGSIYDNEYQLFHGAQEHMTAVDKGLFDAFLLYPQHQIDLWSSGELDIVAEIITKYLIPQVKVDPYRISVDGLSAGGSASWNFMIRYPKLVAACLPISASSTSYSTYINSFKYTPIWHFQGGLDNNPNPQTSEDLGNAILSAGGNYKYTLYPLKGHGCWNNAWAEPDYFNFMLRANKINPWPLYGRTEFCSADAINVTLGVTAGFTSYQWRKDGSVISGATSNTLNVTSVGSYDCRVDDNGSWSAWSPVPVVIRINSSTIAPDITTSGLVTRALPAPDGSTSVNLEVPDGYDSYAWRKVGSSTVLSTTRFLTATSTGDYTVSVIEKYGCTTATSKPFRVVNANGNNAPDEPTGVNASTISSTVVLLKWSQTTNPQYNETNFEIYKSTNKTGPYQLAAITGADVKQTRVTGLDAGVSYYFVMRAVNDNAASAATAPVTTQTGDDQTPPTLPGNLHVGTITKTSVELLWGASTDNVGVVGYDVYINNVKTYFSARPNFIVYNLMAGTNYTFKVIAKDKFDNQSSPAQASAKTLDPSAGNKNGTPTYNAKLNFNDGSTLAPNQKAPWNNTRSLPFEGYTLRKMLNQYKDPTGLKVTLLQTFDGMNYDGMNTGNNSGVYPDRVLSCNWYVERYDTALLKIENLNLNMFYNFNFIGSRQVNDDRTTIYQVGNATASLQCANNTSNLAQINGVKPDEFGAIYIYVYAASSSQYGYLSGLEITSSFTQNVSVVSKATTNFNVLNDSTSLQQVAAYPNPFVKDVTLQINLKNAVSKLNLNVTDGSGKTVTNLSYSNLPSGIWQPNIRFGNTTLRPGIYYLNVIIPGEKTKTIKLLKF